MSKHTTIDQLKMLAQRTKTELAALDGKIVDYGLTKQETAEDGYLATYQLTKNGAPTGDKINIPKDLLVKSASVKEVAEADANESHVYLAVKDLGGSVTVDTATDAEVEAMLTEVFGATTEPEEPTEP